MLGPGFLWFLFISFLFLLWWMHVDCFLDFTHGVLRSVYEK
jgi:hypothetical protein